MIYDFVKQKYQFALEQLRPYLDDLVSAFDTMSKSVVRYQYARGGTNNHRGYYCPSPIRDIVIGNCHRGYLYKTHPRTRQPSFIYGFNAQGELVTTESESCGKEFILYINHATIGISYTISEEYGLWIGTITLCEYNEVGQILLYLVASCPVDGPLLMRQYELELYHYGSEGLETADWYYLLHHDSLYVSHNIFTFQHNADGELSSYTVETRYGIDDVPHKSAVPDHVYEVYVKRKV